MAKKISWSQSRVQLDIPHISRECTLKSSQVSQEIESHEIHKGAGLTG